MIKCDSPDCEQEHAHVLEFDGPSAGPLADVTAYLCEKCYVRQCGGWERLQADAAALRAKGTHPAFVNRIMTVRVDRGDYS